MNSFLDNFQPNIVQFSDDVCIHKSCRGKYMICVNAMGIKWFEENFIKLEHIDGLIEGESLGPMCIMLEDSSANKLDVPRIYIPITEDIVSSDDIIGTFLIKALTDNSVYGEGIEGFRPGKDYYVNNTLYIWLTRKTDHITEDVEALIEENDDIVLPDYLTYDRITDTVSISDYFIELSDEEKKTKNYKYFYNKNKVQELSFSVDELNNLPQTFFSIILEYTMIEESLRSVAPNNGYDAVMNYYKNYKSDAATILLQTIFNQNIVDDTDSTASYICNSCTNTLSTSSSDNINTKSCYEKYKDAMNVWLEIMLADIDYYNDWFMIEEADSKYPNYDMIDSLIELLNASLEYGHWPTTSTTKKYGCSCPSLDSSYTDDECNKNIIMNYIKVLEWTKKCELTQNTNKIKVYGKQFAELLEKY